MLAWINSLVGCFRFDKYVDSFPEAADEAAEETEGFESRTKKKLGKKYKQHLRVVDMFRMVG